MVNYSDELLESVMPILKKLARQLDDSRIDDLVEVGKEAFLKCLKTYDKNRKMKFSTYVYGKAKRAMQDEIRRTGWFKRLNNGFKMTLFSDFDNEDSLIESPEDVILSREKSGVIKEAINKLPEEHGKVIQLIYWNGMTRLECAATMNISEGRVSQLHKEAIELLNKEVISGNDM